ncbi:hypothetical protein BGX23_006874, partial [Mortierella sp. AD031]
MVSPSSPNNNNLKDKGCGQPTETNPKKRGFFKRLFSTDDAQSKAKPEVPKARTKHGSNPEIKPKPSVQEVKATTVLSSESAITTTINTANTATSDKTQPPEVQQQQQQQQPQQLRCDIFPQNVGKPVPVVPLPKLGARLESTTQLAVCRGILPKELPTHPSSTTTGESEELADKSLDETQQAWVRTVVQDENEHERFDSLATRLVVEFIR